MPNRGAGGANYRYGFNGKETENDVKGIGNEQDYGMRIYDPRLGRFLSVDPLTDDYPSWSPYPFAMNRPVDGVDLDGLEWQPVNNKGENVDANSKEIADYKWLGFDAQGKAPKGTVASGSLWMPNSGGGRSLWSFSSNAEDRSGHISIISFNKHEGPMGASEINDRTYQYNYEITIKGNGNYRGKTSYPGFSVTLDRFGQFSDEYTFGPAYYTRGQQMFRTIESELGLGPLSPAIESLGLGPVELLLGTGEFRLAKAASKIIGTAQVTGTAGHAFTSWLIAWRYALDPRVERVTLDLGYKRLLAGGLFRYGPRPDVGILFKSGNVKVFEVLSKTQFNIASRLSLKNQDFMTRFSIMGRVKTVKPFFLK